MKPNNRFFKYLKKFAKEIKKNGKRVSHYRKCKTYELEDEDYIYLLVKDKEYKQLLILKNVRDRLNATVANLEITKDGKVIFREIPKKLTKGIRNEIKERKN